MPKIALYHYTAPTDSHFGSIINQGFIKTCESNASLSKNHAGPDVSWFLDRRIKPGEDHGLLFDPRSRAHREVGIHALGNAKQRAVIEVAVPLAEAHLWIDWVVEQDGYEKGTREIMVKTGGGMSQAKHWYVVTRPVTTREWISATNFVTGEQFTVNALTGSLNRWVA